MIEINLYDYHEPVSFDLELPVNFSREEFEKVCSSTIGIKADFLGNEQQKNYFRIAAKHPYCIFQLGIRFGCLMDEKLF
jgi:hypothetical protein